MKRLRDGAPLDARGVAVSQALLAALLGDLGQDPTGRVRLPSVDFGGARFFGDVSFSEVQFCGDARFSEVQFCGDARFSDARFYGACRLGPLTTTGSLFLDRAEFLQHLTVVVRAQRLSAVGTVFSSGTTIRAQSASIMFTGATFGAASTVSAETGADAFGAPPADDRDRTTIPCVESLRGARLSELSLSVVDLRSCEFRDAQGLEGLHLEQVVFDEMPTRGNRHDNRRFPLWYTRRWAIAEELRWREERRSGSDTSDRGPTAHQIAAVYRALRAGREGRNDEPGAADFYYGEMEMRRHTTYTAPAPGEPVRVQDAKRYDSTRRTPRGEKLVLLLYWSTSGYALRASRALAALLVTVLCGASLLKAFGFPDGESWLRSALFACQSSISLLHIPDRELTAGGEAVTIALRLLGPLFFGLALLSLRGRVRR